MKHFKTLLAAAALATTMGAQAATGSILVSEPGEDGFNIQTGILNGSSYSILSITFDFSSNLAEDGGTLIIDGSPLSVSTPAGTTASFFGAGTSVFGFNFSGFDSFKTVTFKWDPDSTFSTSYGATGLDFINATVTAVTTGGTFSGKFEQVLGTPDVVASLSPVPEPSTWAMFACGLGVAGVVAARRRTTQA
ncbi:MAG TPA: PEP-CTERM sorting domain-containing protein [Candidatus Aquabacterium excrementipullorum]|nr:PEP-CTERM sorting domain-containing protein [Candidatus Aquabacterium excrementipullorum]